MNPGCRASIPSVFLRFLRLLFLGLLSVIQSIRECHLCAFALCGLLLCIDSNFTVGFDCLAIGSRGDDDFHSLAQADVDWPWHCACCCAPA